MTTQFERRELARRAGRFGARLQEHVGGGVTVAVAVLRPADHGAHVLDGETLVSWPLPPNHTVNVTVRTRSVWADPFDAADQVANAIVQGVGAAVSDLELGTAGRCV